MAKGRKTKPSKGKSPDAYKHPVPSEAELLELMRKLGRPVQYSVIASELGLSDKQHQRALSKRLAKMVKAGLILKNRNDEYCLVTKLNLLTGKVSAHRDGFGFLLPDDDHEDVYLSAREMRSLFDGDRIAVRVRSRGERGRYEGKLVEILERGVNEVAGQLVRERGVSFILPDNPKIGHRILIPKGKDGGAEKGDMVVARLIDYPGEGLLASGEVIEVLGDPGAEGMATELAIRAHGIPNVWPAAVSAEASNFGSSVPAPAKRDREDLRSLPLVTIDGADARDFDDAVYCERNDDGFRLIVAIADVAHYVQVASELDKTALERGTSVYFPDRVVPMLPTVLSNGLCSLNPKVDRLSLVCELTLGPRGKVQKSRFYNAVIRSARRLTYSEVGKFLESDGKAGKYSAEIRENLFSLHALYKVMAAVRTRRGALELDIPQLKIVLDDNGKVASIKSYERNDAHKLIEECMIAANVEAAKFLTKHRIPGLYRVHAKPKQARFDEFREYLLTLGFTVPLASDVTGKDFQRLLKAVEDRPDSQAISIALLRSMAHAEYTPENIGHFGLALSQYAHFTSPIRRYPDLIVHRMIKHIIGGGKPGKAPYSATEMLNLGRSTSATERRAEEASREVEAWLKCHYMLDTVGQTFAGEISAVTAFGLFVTITDLQVEGLVHVSNLRNDYYEYDAGAMALVGSRSNKRYTLGDSLEIRVHKVDMDNRRIDFRLGRERR